VHFGASRAARQGGFPGCTKSAHFFGYLITLPVGTVWRLFLASPEPPIFGRFWGSCLGLGMGECLWHTYSAMHRAQHAMLGPDRGGEGLATGSRCAALRAVGGTCPSEEVLPQGKDGSLRSIVRMREGGDRLREPNAARRLECPARCGSATQCALDLADWSQMHIKPSVRTSANGHGRPQAGRGPHSRSELPTPHLAHLAQAAAFSNY
jgi:hypothetical protein